MKFFIVLALVALASANLNYRRNYGSQLSSGSSYGSGLSGLSYGGSSGLALGGGGYGSGLSLGGGYGGGAVGGQGVRLALIQALPVSIASQQVAVAPSLSLGGSYGGQSFGQSYGQSYGSSQQVSGPITAAIQSTRSVQVVDVASTGSAAAPQSIVIGPSVQPIDIEFQSQSSPVTVRQTHIPGQPNPPQSSSHQEEPDYLRQEIVKPVIHEVTEAIQPYRRITQEVRPVQETISQLISRGQQQQQQQQAVGVQGSSAQYVSAAQPSSLAYGAVSQPATLALITSAQPAYSANVASQPLSLALSGSQSFGAQPAFSLGSLGNLGSSYGGSLGNLGSSSYGGSLGNLGSSYGGSYGSLSGSSLSSQPSSLTTSVGVDNYRRRARA